MRLANRYGPARRPCLRWAGSLIGGERRRLAVRTARWAQHPLLESAATGQTCVFAGTAVRLRGVEPPRACSAHKALNLARLPVPPQALAASILEGLLPSAAGATLRTCVPVSEAVRLWTARQGDDR